MHDTEHTIIFQKLDALLDKVSDLDKRLSVAMTTQQYSDISAESAHNRIDALTIRVDELRDKENIRAGKLSIIVVVGVLVVQAVGKFVWAFIEKVIGISGG